MCSLKNFGDFFKYLSYTKKIIVYVKRKFILFIIVDNHQFIVLKMFRTTNIKSSTNKTFGNFAKYPIKLDTPILKAFCRHSMTFTEF